MDFDFSEEQRALAATARELFEKESPASRLRAVWSGAELGRDVWRRMAEVGLTGLVIADEHGGTGGDEIDAALVLEEVGRAGLPDPLAEAVVAARVLSDPDILAALAAGTTIALATDEPFVPDADLADIVIVGARAYTRFAAERVASVDHGRRLFRVTPQDDGVEVEPIGARLAWARASVLNGISMRLLDMTVEHASQRRQFGVAIGSFQAVKHKLATIHALLTAARAAAHYAAYAIARRLSDADRAASTALVEAITAHSAANRDALQIHAGIGFTFEHDLHLWLKRGLALAFGGPEHRATLAAHLFEETPDA